MPDHQVNSFDVEAGVFESTRVGDRKTTLVEGKDPSPLQLG